MAKKRIVLTGGGTVGHVTLNLVLIPKLLEDGWEVHYIGNKKGVEYERIAAFGDRVTFHSIATGKLRRYFSLQNLLDIFKVSWGVVQSLGLLLRLRPQALFSKGGFVSVPPVVAAGLLKVPVFVHESDLSMGLANRIALKFATVMYTTFDQESALSKLKPIGAVTKVTASDQTVSSENLKAVLAQMDSQRPTLLFIGGSAGAQVFNDFVSQTTQLRSLYNIINITGDASLNTLEKGLYRTDYVTEDYQALMDLADVVVTRGGSNTLFELLAMRKLHLIIPLVKGSRGDQVENARYFVDKGYAVSLDEASLTFEDFQAQIQDLLTHRDHYLTAMAQSTEITSPEAFYEELMSAIQQAKGR
ncbi:UDP-N-acetylglucosamine--N-acetylmuramyl-(pentapeptide) pyrophosphoryl-undecaprenol N-acetylglucosamine transferase [Streptococcus sp. DD12]|uniref:UDP-N-acetylglucosamine--N-acetylmuramyl- (pentapeptide) pyrophosphoryl-undecaprenol N-acetylglucosamine transferase n=1 Tax=Streptococcus sp. DD12 TaxID=1777880 RepID=UPI00079C3786|nr:UDP-N-acetylglucosamine--N-acetylmuramyl-(pentapeptide) pyrophosphoryl-undecaprenol N-acetylglucosamine transferase [Streptococcus sp. DD12]KXT75760.1 transferase [Streptococcus sp. DD12]